jgi:hypothetical protein
LSARIAITNAFIDAAKKLPPDRQKAARNALVKFATEPSLNGLNFRGLSAKPGHFIINSAHGDRIILRKDADDLYAAIDIGPHDNVYRRWNRK